MQGTVSLTHGDKVTIHTYTAPELGWRANTHIIELPTQLVLFDAQLTPAFAREVLGITTALNKPITRLYISHAHPDHFAGATEIDAPTYALAEVKQLIDRSGKLRVERGYQYTPGHADPGPITSRPIDHVVEAGEEVIDGVRFSFEPVNDAETTDQLAIGLPDEAILIAPDVPIPRRAPVHRRACLRRLGERACGTRGPAVQRHPAGPRHPRRPSDL